MRRLGSLAGGRSGCASRVLELRRMKKGGGLGFLRAGGGADERGCTVRRLG